MNRNINQKDRMQRLVKSFEEKNEILKESKDISFDENAILKEAERLKEIARIDEWVGNPKTNQNVTGQGVTVNTFMPRSEDTNVKMYNPNYTYLQSNEALSLAIKRAIESGAPINNLGFYEEINWHLNNMGFNPRHALDIKTAIKKMIND